MKRIRTVPVTAVLLLALSLSIMSPAYAYLWPDRNLEEGMSGDDVLSLQTALQDQGYYDGALDGDFGAYTQASLLAYQQANDLVADGVAGPLTLGILYGTPAPAQPAAAAPSTAPASENSGSGEITRSLQRGMTGADVITLQYLLQMQGYYTGALDGDFGSVTERAVLAYQTDVGLYTDGIAGPVTVNALLGVSGLQPQSSQTAQPARQTETAVDLTGISRSLVMGTNGADVTALQQKLATLGYYTGAVDGDFGGMTDAAVRAFQQAKGLVVDGVVGPVTLAALQPASSGTSAAAPQTGTAAATQPATPAAPAGNTGTPAVTGTPSAQAPELTHISNAPGGIEINWNKVDGVSTYRVFRLDNAGSWQPIGDTSELYFIDQNVVSGGRYTYTVRAVAADGSYPGDYDRTGISFTHTYNYDAYVAAAPSYITKAMIETEARKIGLDANEAKGLIAWVEGEGYAYIGEPYVAYLSACVVVNGLLDNAYSRGEGFLQQMSTWGAYFSLENLKQRFSNPSQSTLLAVYLALTQRQPGIYYCRGALSKPQNCFYDSGLFIQGEDIYVW